MPAQAEPLVDAVQRQLLGLVRAGLEVWEGGFHRFDVRCNLAVFVVRLLAQRAGGQQQDVGSLVAPVVLGAFGSAGQHLLPIVIAKGVSQDARSLGARVEVARPGGYWCCHVDSSCCR